MIGDLSVAEINKIGNFGLALLITFSVLFILFGYEYCARVAIAGLIIKIWSIGMHCMRKDERPDL